MDNTKQNEIIRVEQLVKIYTMGDVEVHALRGITLNITTGEFVAIMGASGSGKSTFMNIIGCLDIPTRGEYYLEGISIRLRTKDELAAIRNRKLGFVFQGFNLLSRTSAIENVELPLMYTNHIASKERHQRAVEALRAVGLESREHHMPNQLSGGQQQRVAIARALVNNPALILADEPTGNLDTRTSIEVMEVFQMLNAEGKTIVLITHEKDIAEYAKRVIVFRDGHVKSDTPVLQQRVASEELLRLPAEEEIQV
jgi:putative ABC transport system ATP-binding protein